jgi:hypothetical protein
LLRIFDIFFPANLSPETADLDRDEQRSTVMVVRSVWGRLSTLGAPTHTILEYYLERAGSVITNDPLGNLARRRLG